MVVPLRNHIIVLTCNYRYSCTVVPRSFVKDIDRSLLSTGHLFPMRIKDLMHQLEDIVKCWYQLGVELGLPISKLDEIECNNSSNVLRCKLLMLQEWQRRPTLKPSWCTLVDALHNMKENTVAESISQHFSKFCSD